MKKKIYDLRTALVAVVLLCLGAASAQAKTVNLTLKDGELIGAEDTVAVTDWLGWLTFSKCGVSQGDDVVLTLEGITTLSGTGNDGGKVVFFDGNLTIQGSGTLVVEAVTQPGGGISDGHISVGRGDLTINGGTVVAESIGGSGGYVTINGGTVSARWSIVTGYSLPIEKAGINITGGTVTTGRMLASMGSISISGGTVDGGAIEAYDGSISISGGTVTAKEDFEPAMRATKGINISSSVAIVTPKGGRVDREQYSNNYFVFDGDGKVAKEVVIRTYQESSQDDGLVITPNPALPGQTVTVTSSNAASLLTGITVTMEDGTVIPVKPTAVGTFTFVMPDGPVSIVKKTQAVPQSNRKHVVLPAMKNFTMDPGPGDYYVVSGNNLKFRLRPATGYEFTEKPEITTGIAEYDHRIEYVPVMVGDKVSAYDIRITGIRKDIVVALVNGGIESVSNEPLEVGHAWANAHTLYICVAEASSPVKVYNLAGAAVIDKAFPTGRHAIGNLPAGVYVVRIGGQSFKVVVK